MGMLTMHRSILVDLLGDAEGFILARPAVDTEAAPTSRTVLYEIVEETLSEAVLPALRQPVVAHQTRAAVRVLRHLALADRIGAALEAEDCRDLSLLLGRHVADAAAASRELAGRIDQGELDDPARLLGYFARETTRQAALTRAMMGRLAAVRAPRLPA
jgi:hypothetical protein